MKPISPVLEGYQQHEVTFAKTQKEYMPLPALVLEGDERPVVSRWKPDDDERVRIAGGADILLTQWIFTDKYHPIQMEVSE
jgi:hypothetical protein